MKFYTENNIILSHEEFVQYYNTRYFTNCTAKVLYETDKGTRHSVGKSSKFAEDIIERLLEREQRNIQIQILL